MLKIMDIFVHKSVIVEHMLRMGEKIICCASGGEPSIDSTNTGIVVKGYDPWEMQVNNQ